MRIESIVIQNFLGVPDFRHKLAKPFLFVAGTNGAGKSSLQDALRFALTGELARGLSKVADRPQLITDGAAAGFVQVTVDGFEIRRNIGSGKLTSDSDAPEIPAAMSLCLDAPRFATLPEAERRRMLFDLAGVHVNREMVAEQLTAKKLPVDVVERVLPMLREGFPAAAAYAKQQATEARADWKAITGEVYGSQKAANWSVDVPTEAPLIAEIEETRGFVAAGEQRVQVLSEAKGRAAGAVSAEKRAELQALADRSTELDAMLPELEERYDAAVDALNALERQVPGKQHVSAPCPHCQTMLDIVGTELRITPKAAEPPVKLTAKINGAKQAVTLASRALQDAKDDLRASEVAASTLANLPTPSAEDLSAPALLEDEKKNLQVHRDALRSLEESRHAAEVAQSRTERAQVEHKRVLHWVSAEAELGPDGIPATLLSRALDPINDAIAAQATAAGFRPARVERDLTLTYAGRPYALCSESEQWRADALFAVVVAVMSGCRIVTLDRFDVLDPAARGDTIDWLAEVAKLGFVHSVIVSATLKAKPELGDDVDVIWLAGNGEAMQAAA